MKKKNLWAAVVLLTALTTMGCGHDSYDEANDDPVPTPAPLPDNEEEIIQIELTRTEHELVMSGTEFAFNLFRKARDAQQSTVLSPISITYALGLLNNGAAGQTQQQINQVLGFGDKGADGINYFCYKMLTGAPRLDRQTKVLISNAIFLNQPYQLMREFNQKAASYYDAAAQPFDFHDDQTLSFINQWAYYNTEQMIEQVLSKDEFNADAVCYLLNAIYFNGIWTYKFDKSNTKDEAFHASVEKTLPMMRQKRTFGYGENDLCQTLCLPFGNGHYRMTVLLPREGKTIDDVVQTLTAETWQQQYRYLGEAVVDVKLPRFKSNTDKHLVEVLTQMGMPDAFNRDVADFSAFCTKPTYIDLMKQVACIKVDEQGSEAAAVTAIGMLATSDLEPSEPRHVNFHATRPFLYVISELSTGAIFFVGQYMGD
jgi:serpin B